MAKMDKKLGDKILLGNSWKLCPFQEKDAVNEAYIGWLNDPDVNQFLEVRRNRQDAASTLKYWESVRKDPLRYYWAIRSVSGDAFVGTTTLTVTPETSTGEVGLMIGDKSYWGKGVASEVFDLVAQFTFFHLDLNHFTAGTYSNNEAINHTLKKVGLSIQKTSPKYCEYSPGIMVDKHYWLASKEGWKVRFPIKVITAP